MERKRHTAEEIIKGRTPGEIASVFARVCDAVAALHTLNIVHGDLKSSNVLISSDGWPTIVDLGAAQRAGDPDGVLALTPETACADQLAGGAPEPAWDVHAICGMLRGMAPRSVVAAIGGSHEEGSVGTATALGRPLDDVSRHTPPLVR